LFHIINVVKQRPHKQLSFHTAQCTAVQRKYVFDGVYAWLLLGQMRPDSETLALYKSLTYLLKSPARPSLMPSLFNKCSTRCDN